MRNSARSWISALVVVVLAQPALAGESYYIAIFASQSKPHLPRFAHSFAEFIKVSSRGGDPRIETFTISWLPDVGILEPIAVLPERGRNWDLAGSIQLARAQGCTLCMWGPYQIDKSLYDRAVAQKCRLESGAVKYKTIDSGYLSHRVSNCIHAVSDLDGSKKPLRIASPGYGDSASYYITLTLVPWMIDPRTVHDWLFDALGWRCYGIRRRHLSEGNPSESPIRRATMTMIHLRLERVQRCLYP